MKKKNKPDSCSNGIYNNIVKQEKSRINYKRLMKSINGIILYEVDENTKLNK